MPEAPLLLQIGNCTDRMMARLEAEFRVLPLGEAAARADILARSGAEVVAVATDGHHGVPEDVFAACPGLKVVASYGVGYDAIDADTCVARGILVSHTPDVLNEEVADTAVMLWLSLSKGMIAADAWVRSGRWEREGPMPLTRSVQGRRVGIVGMGRIGQTIARRCMAFGAEIAYHARSKKAAPYPYHAELVDLAAWAEVLMVITPGGAATRHLVNRAVMDALGPEGMLINVARGTVVDEAALVDALAEGRLGGAGLDVFEQEPRVAEGLLSMPNVVLAPHIGSATVETRQAMGDLVCDNLSQYLKTGGLLTPIPECLPLMG